MYSRRHCEDEPQTLMDLIRQNPAVLILTVLFAMLVMFAVLLFLDT